MIFDNVIFWQSVVFMVFGYVFAWTVYALTAIPQRLLVEAS